MKYFLYLCALFVCKGLELKLRIKNITRYGCSTGPIAIMMGSEEDGISEAYLKRVDDHLVIPMPGDIDSLNVSVATGIVTFEVVRQRLK